MIYLPFLLFALMLAGIALAHRHATAIALAGLAAVTVHALASGSLHGGLVAHLQGEATTLVNLFLLLTGFALLADHVQGSGLPDRLPHWLPGGWQGGFALLVSIFLLSAVLDNIAAALIGAAIAASLYRERVRVGYLAAIVAASNAGGAGSVLGDTTTTMMWLAGVHPLQVLEAYVAAVPALLCFGVIAARSQQRYQPLALDAGAKPPLDLPRLAISIAVLLAAVAANAGGALVDPGLTRHVPLIGLAVWLVMLLAAPWRAPSWRLLPGAVRGAVFLCSLVLCASMMPVQHLPSASWPVAFGLGLVSAVFDNIPLTALALQQGGYDWGFVAYAVGFGGSMVWFGSSAGVAVAGRFPDAASVRAWLREGWPVAVGYAIGFALLLWLHGWHPDTMR